MIVIGDRAQTLPAPPHVVAEALREPQRQDARRWLHLWSGERPPSTITALTADRVRWSSLWSERPDVVVEFELSPDGHGGTRLRFVLTADEPVPDEAMIGQLRYRMNRLLFGDLRLSFGQ